MQPAQAKKRVLVFCGAAPGSDLRYTQAAAAFGKAVAVRGWGLIYGGHHAGMMGAVAAACRRHGGPVLGILPDSLSGKEHPPDDIELLRVVDMHTRKTMMVNRCDVIVALPGGYGTLDELFEQLTWRAIGVHQKPIGILDVVLPDESAAGGGRSYWQPLLTFLDHAVVEGFVRPQARATPIIDDDVDGLLDRLGVTG